ncbi:hypothetical protein Spb1_17120 [Planctopirus ephydatiae]|uniref:Glycosyltransferase 2-like domain-containing protein n=1 Tax=Planctopirus ephydatiae TaxID=2528019 RepID=A0A518GMC8_9PLAN|nr:hypothetical protein Spb1_17120 [Planctopirus ephydatiae]
MLANDVFQRTAALTSDEPHTAIGRTPPRVSVAIPVYNEEALIQELMRRVLAVLDGLPGGPHQLVLVDDGSRDRTFACICAAAQHDRRILPVALSRNFGHQIALTAALDYADGDLVVMMDGDLQDRPEVIPDMLTLWRDGADVVYAVRTRRKETWLLKTCYQAFYRVIERLAHLKLPRDSGDFCLVSREVADVMRTTREQHRYLRGLRAWAGFRQEPLLVERDARSAGDSKYGFRQLFQLAFDGIFSFSTVPIRVATWLGLTTVALTLFLGLFWVVAWSLNYAPQGFTALATSIAFFGGVQLVFLGLIGEYVGRIYEEVKNRPLYVVRKSSETGASAWPDDTPPAIQGLSAFTKRI